MKKCKIVKRNILVVSWDARRKKCVEWREGDPNETLATAEFTYGAYGKKYGGFVE